MLKRAFKVIGLVLFVLVLIAGLTYKWVRSLEPVVQTYRGAPKQVVYVDVTKLVRRHPGWHSIVAAHSVIADIRSSKNITPGRAVESARAVSMLVPKPVVRVSRQNLESEAARRANVAFKDLEEEQRHAIKARLDASRTVMSDSAEADTRVRVHDIETKSAQSARAISQKYRDARVKAQLDIAAATASLKVAGVSVDAVKQRLAKSENQLAAVDMAQASEIDAVTKDAKKQIDELARNTSSKIETAIEAYGASETRKLERKIAGSRSQILKDVDTCDDLLHVGTGLTSLSLESLPGQVQHRAAAKSAGYSVDERLDEKSSTLRARIERDVRCAVQQLAKERGVKVVFKRTSKSLKDETDIFADLMQTRGWRVCGPIIYQGAGI